MPWLAINIINDIDGLRTLNLATNRSISWHRLLRRITFIGWNYGEQCERFDNFLKVVKSNTQRLWRGLRRHIPERSLLLEENL